MSVSGIISVYRIRCRKLPSNTKPSGKKMRKTAIGVLTSVALIVCTAATTQAQWEEQVTAQLEGADNLMRDRGFTLVQAYHISTLEQSSSEKVTVTLTAGLEYQFLGVCDNDCSDLDLTLYDPSGDAVATDVELDDTPILLYTPIRSGNFQIEISMVSCEISPCFYGFGVWAKGGGGREQAGQPSTYRGELKKGDSQLGAGEYYDTYTFQAGAGQHVVVDMTSGDFDTYVGVASPSGENTENDDFEESTSHSRVEMDLNESGTWNVIATSYEKGETGSYIVTITLSGAAGSASGGSRIESGMLAKGDDTFSSGEYIDYYTMEGRRGEKIVIDLRSAEFDPYLIVEAPSSEQFHNDDHEGDASRSLLSLDLTEDGTYRIMVTSYAAGETGNYDLLIQSGSAVAAAGGSRVERGELAAGDESLRSGEYADVFTFEGMPGQHVRLDVSSSEFDTYLMLRGPGEISHENDDVEDAPGHSIIDMDLTEMGTYRVIVTSYTTGETGRYELNIDLAEAGTGGSRQRDVHTIEMGGHITGRLEAGDTQLEGGEYRDLYVFDGTAGQNIVIEMTSSDFDTYLGLIFPSEEQVDNDDFEGDMTKSRIELSLPESGRYRVLATSYESGPTGTYRITLASGTTARPGTGPTPTPGAGRVYGIFVGISDYPGERNDLPYTADDARRVYQSMMQGAGMQSSDGIVLVDSDATVGNIRNTFQQMGGLVSQNDLFIFFYSGHGGRQERASHQPSDPDGMDETLFLYDGAITDDEMSDLFDQISSHVSLIVLDACFSGGFSKDVISVPGRMGLFSSEEDVTSSVAAKFRAGGFLAQFIADAIGERLADADGDNQLTSLELSQYLHDRYRSDVKSGGADDYVRTGGPQLGYQHLVVDRGSIGPSTVIFK